MPAFRFEALDATGRAKNGLIEADNARAARAQLRAQQLVPLGVRQVGVQAAGDAAKAGTFSRRAFGPTALAVWTRQLAGLVTSGLPLERALTALSDEAEDQRQRELVAHLRAEVNAGSSFAKALGAEATEALRILLGLGEGDAVFFVAGKPEHFEPIAGRARMEIGRELGLVEEGVFKFAWIVDFPMYEKDPETGRIDFSHNPFSMPQGGMEALNGDPLKVLGYQYDLACNGYELVSGAIRNHKPEIMFKAFELAGYGREEVEKRFGGMVKAFKYGAPPHGGCAAGIDRIVMLLADTANIREVIMFPMNQRAEDLMMGAPSEPTNEQLRELRLRVIPKE